MYVCICFKFLLALKKAKKKCFKNSAKELESTGASSGTLSLGNFEPVLYQL